MTRRPVQILSLVLLFSLLSFAPARTTTPVAYAANALTYNIFATDAFIALADGTQLYIYGFVGGRSDQPVQYQNSMVPAMGIGKAGDLITPATPKAQCTGNWPTPAPGPIVKGSCEQQLAGDAQYPAPLIYAAVDDTVTINFKNLGVTNTGSPNDPHSIHLHGLDVDAANDGVPETSVGAVPANLAVPGAGNVVVYMFTAKNPGTYMYHCHQEADIHVQMGMYGALIIYNPGDANYNAGDKAAGGPGSNLGGGTLWGWNYTKEYVLLLSEFDTRQHVSEQKGLVGGNAFNPVMYQPQYWTINGLSFPNTVHANGAPANVAPFTWANWIGGHPGYDPLITGSVSKGDKVLLRVINMGFETQPMHMHGFHGKILGSDQRAWTWAQPGANNWGADPNNALNVGLEKNTLTVGSGETYEWLLDFSKQTTALPSYPAGSQSRYTIANNLPAANGQTANPAIPVPGLPGVSYIGGPPVNGTLIGDPAGKGTQYYPFHNHDDYKATNNGVYPGGMFTMIVPTP